MNGATFRLYRLCMGWELVTAGEKLGVDRRTIQRWENGSWDIPQSAQEFMGGEWADFVDSLTVYIEALEEGAEHNEALGRPVEPVEFTIPDEPEALARVKALACALAVDEFDIVARRAD